MVSPSRCPPWQPERPGPTRREPRRAQRSYTTPRDTIPQDYSEAVKWFRLAAVQGGTGAQNNLGNMYYYGRGVAQDFAEAAKCYRKAADQNWPIAQKNLGEMYRDGRGVPQNYAVAATWFKHAAGQGDAIAETNLGVLYANGRGVPQSDAEALKWYRKAAVQGQASAQYNLGNMYREGRGVPQDDAEAAKRRRSRIGPAAKKTSASLMPKAEVFRRITYRPSCGLTWQQSRTKTRSRTAMILQNERLPNRSPRRSVLPASGSQRSRSGRIILAYPVYTHTH